MSKCFAGAARAFLWALPPLVLALAALGAAAQPPNHSPSAGATETACKKSAELLSEYALTPTHSTHRAPGPAESVPNPSSPPAPVRATPGDELTIAVVGKNGTAVSDPAKLHAALAAARDCAKPHPPRLQLGGMAVGPGARLVNSEDWTRGYFTFELRSQLPAGSSETEMAVVSDFWNAVFRRAGWSRTVAMSAEIRVGDGTLTLHESDKTARLEIGASTETRKAFAGLVGFALLTFFVWALFRVPIFRDRAPAWIESARALEGLRQNESDWMAELASRATMLGIQPVELRKQARSAFLRLKDDPATPSDQDSQLAAIGALDIGKTAPKVSFSLSRVQMGGWLIVTVVGSLAIWIVHGRLPVLPETYLALLGISVGTTMLSGVMDRNRAHPIGTVHRGFWTDLTEGTNGGGVHRYQALMVNLLLWSTVLFELLRNLQFREIDSTWLVLLTGSSGTYVAVKQISEQATGTRP